MVCFSFIVYSCVRQIAISLIECCCSTSMLLSVPKRALINVNFVTLISSPISKQNSYKTRLSIRTVFSF